jgi:serine acetyltransferase
MWIEGFIAVFYIGLIFWYAGAQVYFINRILAIWTGQTKWQASEAHGTDRRIRVIPTCSVASAAYSGTGFYLEHKTDLRKTHDQFSSC